MNTCNEYGKSEGLMKFKSETEIFFICQRCWDEKIERGIKNSNRLLNDKKFFDPRLKHKQI